MCSVQLEQDISKWRTPTNLHEEYGHSGMVDQKRSIRDWLYGRALTGEKTIAGDTN